MANWAAEIYNTLKDAKEAIEAINDGKEIQVTAFKEGALQKVLLAQGNSYTYLLLEPLSTTLLEEAQAVAAGIDVVIGTIVVDVIPAGATVTGAYVDFDFRAVENISAVDANALSGVQYVQIKKGAGAYANATTLSANTFGLAIATREGGRLIKGNINVSATVTGNDTYTIQWTAAKSTVNSLNFNDVQAILRIAYSI